MASRSSSWTGPESAAPSTRRWAAPVNRSRLMPVILSASASICSRRSPMSRRIASVTGSTKSSLNTWRAGLCPCTAAAAASRAAATSAPER